MLAVGLHRCSLSRRGKSSLFLCFFLCFYHEWVFSFVKCFSVAIDRITWFSLLDYSCRITLMGFWILKPSYILGIISTWSCHVILLTHCRITFVSILCLCSSAFYYFSHLSGFSLLHTFFSRVFLFHLLCFSVLKFSFGFFFFYIFYFFA